MSSVGFKQNGRRETRKSGSLRKNRKEKEVGVEADDVSEEEEDLKQEYMLKEGEHRICQMKFGHH